MVLFHQAVFALLFASNAVGSSIRSLQNTYEIDVPIVCYYDGIATSDAVCHTSSTTSFSLPDGHVPGVPSLVTIWPHDDVTGYGTIDQDYYADGCTDLLIPLQQALFPPPADPDVNEDGSTLNVFAGGNVVTAATPHKPAISIYSFPLTFLDSLPNQLVSVTGDVTTVTFCQRFQLFQTSSGSELGFREADITVIYDVDGTTSLNVQINDIDPTTPADFDLGDYSIIAQRCDDGDADPTNGGGGAVTQGTPVEICLYPVKNLVAATNPSADRTTDIIIRRVEDFTFTVGSVQQAAFSGGVKADETSVAAADGNACAEGLGEPDSLTTPLAGLHGCEFSTLLDAAFYDTDTAAAGAAVTAATTGLVTIEFRGARRKLQVFGAGDQATLATNGISLLLREEEKTEDGACSDWWFIFRWICEIWVFIFGS